MPKEFHDCTKCNRFLTTGGKSIQGLCIVSGQLLKRSTWACDTFGEPGEKQPSMSEARLKQLTKVLLGVKSFIGESRVALTIMHLCEYYKHNVAAHNSNGGATNVRIQ